MLDHGPVAVQVAAQDEVVEDLLLDVVGQAETDEVPLVEPWETGERAVGGGRCGGGVVEAHQPPVPRGDGTITSAGQAVVENPGGTLAEPL